MITPETAVLFFVASVALALSPGPDNIFVLTESALYGRKAGLLITAGLCSGLLVHTAAVALGVAAIIQSSSLAFNALKIAGAIYLLYLAWQAFRAKVTSLDTSKKANLTSGKLYARGIIMNLANPKVAIFFLAYLPQFSDPSVGRLQTQMLMLGGLFIVAALLTFSTIAWTAGTLGEWFAKSAKTQLLINRIAGLVFVSLAIKLAISQR